MFFIFVGEFLCSSSIALRVMFRYIITKSVLFSFPHTVPWGGKITSLTDVRADGMSIYVRQQVQGRRQLQNEETLGSCDGPSNSIFLLYEEEICFLTYHF